MAKPNIDIAVDRVTAIKVGGEWLAVTGRSLEVANGQLVDEVGAVVGLGPFIEWVGDAGQVYAVPLPTVQAFKSER